MLFWRCRCKSPRACIQSPVRITKGDGSGFSLTTGGNPKQQDLSKYIYLQCSCVCLPHLTLLVARSNLPACFCSGVHWANKLFPQETEEVKGAIGFEAFSYFAIVSWTRDNRHWILLTSGIDLLVREQIQHAWKNKENV